MLAAPLLQLCREGRIGEFRWPGRGKDDDVAVGIGRGDVPGVPRRVGWAVDAAAAVRTGALGQGVIGINIIEVTKAKQDMVDRLLGEFGLAARRTRGTVVRSIRAAAARL